MFCVALFFAFTSSDFACDGFIRSKPAGASQRGKCVRLHFQSNTHTEEILNDVAEAARAGGLRLLFRLLFDIGFLLRTRRRRTRVFGSVRLASADCFPSLASSFVWCRPPTSRLATSFTFSFSVRLGDKDAFGDVRSAAFQRRQDEPLWKRGRRGAPFLHLSSSRHQQLLQRLAEQTPAQTRTNRQKQTG